jgi:hypothetical protein
MHTQSVGLIFAAFVASVKGFTSPACSNLVSKEAVSKLSMSDFADDFMQDTPDQTQQRIQDLVDEHPVLLFMKGTKIFPSCGFSSTAVQILNTFNIDFHSGMYFICVALLFLTPRTLANTI